MGVIADQLRANLKRVAESDARALRATSEMLTEIRSQIAAEAPLLAGSQADEIAAAIELLQSAATCATRLSGLANRPHRPVGQCWRGVSCLQRGAWERLQGGRCASVGW